MAAAWSAGERAALTSGERRFPLSLLTTPSPLARPSRETRAAALAFLTAGVMLFVQILVHRIISVKLLNNYAFLVISLTMLGLALSGVILSRMRPFFLRRLEDVLPACSAGFALSTVIVTMIFYRAEAGLQTAASRWDFLQHFLGWLPLALLFALPFTFLGLILGSLLSDRRFATRRVYFFDLMGSALGSILVIPAVSRLGAEYALLMACAAEVVGSLLLFRPSSRPVRGLAALALALLAAATLGRGWAFTMRYPPGSMLDWIQRQPPPLGLEHVAWDPIARIEVSRITGPSVDFMPYPELIGEDRAFHRRFERLLTQNNYAFTYAVHYTGPESLSGIERTIYASAYQAGAAERPRVFVIGVGGGFDILTALRFDASAVTAVEVNAATVKILRETYADYFGGWVRDPRVELVLGDGRHVLERSDQRFDVIQLSGVDSYAGTPGAAHVFSENYLYTEQAFDLYLARLTDAGIVNMMRLEYMPPREMLRALTTAVGALRRSGVTRPSEHIVMLAANSGRFVAMLVKKTPFRHEEVRRLTEWAGGSPFFRVVVSPEGSLNPSHPYSAFLALDDPRQERLVILRYPFDITPSTDDRPFFFKYSRWSHLISADPIAAASVPVMELSLLVLSIVVGLAALLCVYVPLRYLGRRKRKRGPPWRFGAFFAFIAVGYLAVEVALLQKFGLFLGHPNYALSVVLGALLASTGVGSLWSGRIVRRLGNLRFVAYMFGALVLLQYAGLSHLGAWVGMPFAARVLIVVALVLPVGLCLGTFLPTGLDRLKAVAPAWVPWAWGVNGIFSVLAPIWAIGFSMSWGIDALLLGAVPIYLMAGALLPGAEPAVAPRGALPGLIGATP